MAQRQFRSDDTSKWVYGFGNGSDGALSISSDTTEAPIDSACTGTAGTTSLSATNASFAAGQLILIHQTRHATTYGAWELNKISSYVAGTITTVHPLMNTYAAGAQVRVMKQYSSVTIASSKTYTAKAWNGTVGGILGFFCNGTTTVTGTIEASSKGFRGGVYGNETYGHQGESDIGFGTYTYTANGGGGGGGRTETSSDNSSGGGGGGHGATGTTGTNGGAGSAGIGGEIYDTADLVTMTLGSAGGSGGGSTNPSYPGGTGGAGGGIVFIISKNISVGGYIKANGGAGTSNRAGGGGGAGGSILVKAQTAVLGTALALATAGAGGPTDHGGAGGAGAVGRIHADYLTSLTGTTTPTLDASQDKSLISSSPKIIIIS